MSLNAHRLLEQFRKVKKTKNRRVEAAPKLEYVRTTVLRHFKKAIRSVLKGKLPISGLHKYQPASLEWGLKWRSFVLQVNDYATHLESISSLANGPYIDNRSNEEFTTYTNRYVEHFFSDEVTYQTFLCYLEVLKSDETIPTYCKVFTMQCCQDVHSEECLMKWKQFFWLLAAKMNSKAQQKTCSVGVE